MATKAEVRAFLDKNYVLEEIEGGILKFVFRTDQDRTQLVFAVVDDVKAQFFSPFATTNDVSAEQALDAADSTSFGVKKFGSWYCIVNVNPLDNLDANEIEVSLNILSGIADEIEKNLGLGDNL
jgi:hypothetical protein